LTKINSGIERNQGYQRSLEQDRMETVKEGSNS
jgi:hypothetical protein